MMDRNGVRMRIGGYMCYSCKKKMVKFSFKK
jgi:hypothetical protein